MIEVHPGMVRTGKQILSKFAEATQAIGHYDVIVIIKQILSKFAEATQAIGHNAYVLVLILHSFIS